MNLCFSRQITKAKESTYNLEIPKFGNLQNDQQELSILAKNIISMTNNDVLRKLRYTFDLNDDKVMSLFASGGYEATRTEISDWMKKDDDEAYKNLGDKYLAAFLNGFINAKRGKKEGPQPDPEKKLNNNIILRKLKIALNMQDEDMLDTLDLADFRFSKSELSAFFRKPDHRHYRECKDQVLRNFLLGLQFKYRSNKNEID
jgi:uncharacterized protein YehS (DUF1456 family)